MINSHYRCILDGLRYRPGIGLKRKKVQESSKSVEHENFEIIFSVSFSPLQKGAAFFLIRVVKCMRKDVKGPSVTQITPLSPGFIIKGPTVTQISLLSLRFNVKGPTVT